MTRLSQLLRLVPVATLLAALCPAQATSAPASEPPKRGLPTFEDLVARLESKEKASKSVQMTMETTGWFPGGRTVKTSGELRVLGKTHVHVRMVEDFGDELKGEHEMVKTPEGAWTKETDPAQGTVYVSIKPELLKKLDEAQAKLGEGDVSGIPNDINESRGSAMLRSLHKTFDLKVDRKLAETDEIVVKGNARAEARSDESELPDADAVEVLVREKDAAITVMRQFKDGKRILEVRIKSLELDRDLDKSSFRIALPEGAKFIDAMEHPPMREQIERVLKDAGLMDSAKDPKK